MTRQLLVPAIALAAVTLAGCGTAPGSESEDHSGDGDYVLVSSEVDGHAVVPPKGADITLVINGADVRGRSGCNQYSATMADGGAISDLGSTEMGCDKPLMTFEDAYLGALARVTSGFDNAGLLVLQGDGVDLRYKPQPAPTSAPLMGTSWQLDSVITSGGEDGTASSAVGEPATLVFGTDGELNGSTGCNSFGGSYEIDGGTVTVGPLHSTMMACPDPIATQERQILAILGEPFTPTIEGDLMTITTDNGAGLVYRAQK